MAEPALAYPQTPPPCPALDAILAHDEYSLPETDGLPLADGRVQQIPLNYSRDALRYRLRHLNDHVAVEGDMFIYYIGRDEDGLPKRQVDAAKAQVAELQAQVRRLRGEV